jgi:hypothetical protein
MPEETREHQRDATSTTPERPAPGLGAPNKLHEWGAAVLLMLVLTAILAFFVRLLRV